MANAEDNDRLEEIARELRGLSEELASIGDERAAMLKRGLDAGLRAVPETVRQQQA